MLNIFSKSALRAKKRLHRIRRLIGRLRVFRRKKSGAVYFLICIFFIFGLLGSVLAINSPSEGYRSNAGTTIEVDVHSDCHKVVNSSGNDYFVPTRTNAEWQAFQNNLPAGVSLDACCTVTDTCDHKACLGDELWCVDNCDDAYQYMDKDCQSLAGDTYWESSGDGWCDPNYMYCATSGMFNDSYWYHRDQRQYTGDCVSAHCESTLLQEDVEFLRTCGDNEHVVDTGIVGCTCVTPEPACD